MKNAAIRAAAVRALFVVAAASAAMTACTPLQVVTHTVSTTESRVPAGPYKLDADHWSVIFDVDHFKYSRFAMRFDRVTGQLDWRDGGMENSAVAITIDASSIDTNVPLLDKMVKGDEMLDVARYPDIRFVSTHFERTGDAVGKLTGDLTIRGTTQPVTLDVKFNGYGVDPLTKLDTIGFSAQGSFSRSKFGLTSWFPAVGDDVHVRVQAEFDKPRAGASG
ncbi:YceI family protein [Paraburkholderia solisilvae]|uniref:Protein YceI n=1 Tax=Paraburkholderia solisilvae TaxID=624376 RepID=A0A6J5D131_9BURK|nr:YceI family protein [Paraburkholderia solisilvae]CAB3747929.1 Protein YceI [Paraburkholderia solisilvae]